MHLSRLSLAAVLFALCLGMPQAFAEEPPQIESVQQSLDSLAERKLPEPEQLALKQTLEQTLRLLKDREVSEQHLADLRTQLENAPRLIAEAQRELARLKASKPAPLAERHARTDMFL